MVEHRSERVEAGIKLLQSVEHAGEENQNLISQGWYLYNTKQVRFTSMESISPHLGQGIEIWKNASMASVHAVMGRGTIPFLRTLMGESQLMNVRGCVGQPPRVWQDCDGHWRCRGIRSAAEVRIRSFSGDISDDPSLGPREARQLAQLDEHNEVYRNPRLLLWLLRRLVLLFWDLTK